MSGKKAESVSRIVCYVRQMFIVFVIVNLCVTSLASTLLIACLSHASSSQINARAGKLNNTRMKVIINHVNNNQSHYYITLVVILFGPV